MPHEVGLLARSMIQSLVSSQSSNRPSFVEDLSGRLQHSPRATSLEIGLEPVGLLTFAIPHHLAAGRVHVLRACLAAIGGPALGRRVAYGVVDLWRNGRLWELLADRVRGLPRLAAMGS